MESVRVNRTGGHPFIELIQAYYEGCNTQDYELLRSTLSDDVVHYFVDHGAVQGSAGLANYWCKVAPRTRAHWQLDHALVQGEEVVIEWSMAWLPPGASEKELLRGSEWYVFRGGKIAEIRSYHCNYHLSAPENRQLHDFPYSERGYRREP